MPADVQSPLSTANAKLALELSQKIPPPWKHQAETLQFSLEHDEVFDTSDPGTGKTRGHIDVFVQRLAEEKTKKLLVVCPKTLMRSAWLADIRKFAPNLTVSIATADVREGAFDVDVDVYIVNSDGVKWLQKQTPGWWKKHFPKNSSLVVDESTAFKHHTSQRSKAMKKVSKNFKYRALLTGTPITSSVTDIWHQLMILDGGERLGTSFTAFRNNVQNPVMNGRFTRWEDKEGIEELVSILVKDISIRHQFDKVMDVPENYSRTVTFDLSAKALKAYKQMEEEAYIELKDGDVSAVNAAVLRNKLLQIASGAVYDSEGQSHYIDTTRHELVADLVEERDVSVVFYNWEHQREELIRQFKKRGLSYEAIYGGVPDKERARIVDEVQAGNIRAILLHPQTGAHGLTLTRGRTTIWASPRYEPDFLKQGIHRVYRGGQTQKTENIMVQAADTVEPLVYDKLGNKYTRMVNLLDLLEKVRGVR